MNIVVDTNVVFSALLNTNGKISDLLLNSEPNLNFFAPTFIMEELARHHQKLLRLSRIDESNLIFLRTKVLEKVRLIDLSILSDEIWRNAIELVSTVDEFDAPFVALALHLEAQLWTGDKKLTAGLRSRNQLWVLDTDQLFEIKQRMD